MRTLANWQGQKLKFLKVIPQIVIITVIYNLICCSLPLHLCFLRSTSHYQCHCINAHCNDKKLRIRYEWPLVMSTQSALCSADWIIVWASLSLVYPQKSSCFSLGRMNPFYPHCRHFETLQAVPMFPPSQFGSCY